MKTKAIFLLFGLLPLFIFAVPINIKTARKVAESRIDRAGKTNEIFIKNITAFNEAGTTYFYTVELIPEGYIIVSADDNLPPIIAYSYQDNIEPTGKLFDILKHDISKRLANIEIVPENVIKNRKKQWAELVQGTYKRDIQVEQWPPAGTTSTGGWLETNWTQTSPYNQQCPIDPVTSSRSYTGCPATAMAQILNYHRTTNNTYFDNSDDYYHNYAGRKFWIDDDYADNGFPSFPQLNTYLDTLNAHYQNNVSLTNQDKAALSFACGVAASQVYTSEGSGTFSVSQAFDSYQRFGCYTSELLYESDTNLYSRLAQNMKDSLPAHLALVDEAWSTGHNVVVDGYNSDNYFHVNFGWGGTYNSWYLLPDEMPYSLTVVEGLIVDIMKDETVAILEAEKTSSFKMYPNPATNVVTLETGINSSSLVTICNINGKIVYSGTISNCKQINISRFYQGVYIVNVQGTENYTKKLVIMN